MYTVKEILRMEVTPALGCTEPAAIAYGAAYAKSLLKETGVEKIEIYLDPNVYKNAMAVPIPGADGRSGLKLAAALGFACGDRNKKLRIFDDVDKDCIKAAYRLINSDKIAVNLISDKKEIYIKSVIKTKNGEAVSIIKRYHDNIENLRLNGIELTGNDEKTSGQNRSNPIDDMEKWLSSLKLDNLLSMLDDVDDEDLTFIKQGVDMNMALSDYGLKNRSGLGVGYAIKNMIKEGFLKEDIASKAKMITSAAADARMAGIKLPAMSCVGSGNHGICATLPVWAAGKYKNMDEAKIYKAIALSHLVAAYIKTYTGRLSAICGAAVAAASGAAAGITYMLSGDKDYTANAISNVIQDLSGIVCDGAKLGCAFKLATAAEEAVSASLLSINNVKANPIDGIMGSSVEESIKNLGILSKKGMAEADKTMLNIMIKKST